VRRARQGRLQTHDARRGRFASATQQRAWRASRLPLREGAGAEVRVASARASAVAMFDLPL
jgi:hypothetical protein